MSHFHFWCHEGCFLISCIFDWVSETSRKNEKDRLILHFYSIYKQQFLGTLKSFENHAGILKIMNVSDENRNEGTTFMKARRTNNWLFRQISFPEWSWECFSTRDKSKLVTRMTTTAASLWRHRVKQFKMKRHRQHGDWNGKFLKSRKDGGCSCCCRWWTSARTPTSLSWSWSTEDSRVGKNPWITFASWLANYEIKPLLSLGSSSQSVMKFIRVMASYW